MSDHNRFFTEHRLTVVDRGLFLGAIISHILILFEPAKQAIANFSAQTALVVYVILICSFWSYFFISFMSKQVKTIQRDNNLLVAASAECMKQIGYLDAYPDFALGFSLIHQIQRRIPENPKTSVVNEDQIAHIILYFEEVCLHFADGFKQITGVKDISVCIKLLNGKKISSSSSVRTFVRDSKNVGRNYEENGATHLIEKNTAYQKILKLMNSGQEGRCFISNNLPELKGYLNTTFPVHGQEEYKDDDTNEYRHENWKMPYKSTIVVGIYPNQKHYYNEKYLIGFLCVDSNSLDIFNVKHDPIILTGAADGIYNALKGFNNLTKSKKSWEV